MFTSIPPRLHRAFLWMALATGILPVAWALALACIPPFLGNEPGTGYASVERSLCALGRDGSARIIVGGDSRAMEQVDPVIFDSVTGRQTINVAEALPMGGDLPTLVNVLRRYPKVLEARPVLVVSVSVAGLNDKNLQLMTMATLLNWSPWDHLRIALAQPGPYLHYVAGYYAPFLRRLIGRKLRHEDFVCDDGVRLPPASMRARGFRPVYGDGPLVEGRDPARSRGEYLLRGGKWRVFRASLEWLEQSPARAVIIYNAPLLPEFKADPKHAEEMEMEAELSALMEAEAARHGKVRYLDFVRHPPAGLAWEHFYDYGHLNGAGAVLFSRALAERVKELVPDP